MPTNAIPDAIRPLVEKIDPGRLYDEGETSELTGFKPKTLQDRRRLGKPPEYLRFGTRSIRYPGQGLINALVGGLVGCK